MYLLIIVYILRRAMIQLAFHLETIRKLYIHACLDASALRNAGDNSLVYKYTTLYTKINRANAVAMMTYTRALSLSFEYIYD